MLKRTIHISKPTKVSLRNGQLIISQRNADGISNESSLPIEDLWALILEDQQISITQGAIAELLEHNVALITCDSKHHPVGMMLNLCGHSTQTERFRYQTQASSPLKKQLWQQTVKAKIENQGYLIARLNLADTYLNRLALDVKSGDSTNREGVAAAYYWPRIFPDYPTFHRDHGHHYINALLNYGYAIIRAMVARGLVGSGLLPALGIHHRNRYNHYCLADDIMEPYRPYVDRLVSQIISELNSFPETLAKEHKIELLKLPVMDVQMNGKMRPMLVATTETTSSLVKCFTGEQRKLSYPQI